MKFNIIKVVGILFIFYITTLKGYAANFTVTSNGDAGANTLRQAIIDANLSVGPHTINFSGAMTITLSSNLPALTRAITINGGSVVELNCNGRTAFWIQNDGCQIIGIAINRSNWFSIWINGVNNCVVKGCFIGTDFLGATTKGNTDCGIYINNANNNTIGGTLGSDANIIGKNTVTGIKVDGTSTGNVILGNFIGTNSSGTALGNATGILFDAVVNSNTVGSLTTKNIISKNTIDGISIQNNSRNISVIGNYIGVDPTGLIDWGNSRYGIFIFNSDDNYIGSSSTGGKNIISGNGDIGIQIFDGSSGNQIRNNFIGLNEPGTLKISNDNFGIQIQQNGSGTPSGNIIGGASANEGNVISGNGDHGLRVLWSNTTIIKGNIIGLNALGTAAIGNGQGGVGGSQNGVDLNNSHGNIIGGELPGEENIISGNLGNGIVIFENAYNNTIQGNIIGLNKAGNAAIGNGGAGINIFTNSTGSIPGNTSSNLIGGINANQGNIISANGWWGIRMENARNSLVYGNNIGTDFGGTVNYGNLNGGITIEKSAGNGSWDYYGNIIGYDFAGTTGAQNIIAFNSGPGVNVQGSADVYGNPIRINSMYCNTGKGININTSGNTGISRPTLDLSSTGSNLFGTAPPSSKVDLYYYDISCPCPGATRQGKTYITTVTASAGGNWSYTGGVSNTLNIALNATNSTNNSSEFNDCSVPLPINLISFNGHRELENVNITWHTSIEINNNYFEVLKSIDGYTWEVVTIVNSNSKQTYQNNYSIVDMNNYSGITYYKLKQVDFDGEYSYSNTIIIDGFINKSNNIFKEILTSGNHTIEIGISTDNTLESGLDVRITDVTGKEIGLIFKEMNGTKVILNFTINTDGLYFILINDDLKNNYNQIQIK